MKSLVCVQTVFSKQQIAEQQEFKKELQSGNAKIAFAGTFENGIKFLKETGELVDIINHS